MRDEGELERLQHQVERAKELVHQSEIKVEELEASVLENCDLKHRVVLFHRDGKSKFAA